MATMGTAKAAATCIGPESLVIIRLLPARAAIICLTLVLPMTFL
jgi:hypothetical protein